MAQASDDHKLPSHICPQCGEWWDVESGGCDTWFVEPHDNDGRLIAKVWTEASQEPVCPLDAFTLKCFCIAEA